MASFKDIIKADAANTVFNTNEFADVITIDGMTIPIVFDDLQLEKYNLKVDGEGLTKGELLFYVSKSVNIEFFRGKRIRFANKLYEILDVKDDFDILIVTLVGYRS